MQSETERANLCRTSATTGGSYRGEDGGSNVRVAVGSVLGDEGEAAASPTLVPCRGVAGGDRVPRVDASLLIRCCSRFSVSTRLRCRCSNSRRSCCRAVSDARSSPSRRASCCLLSCRARCSPSSSADGEFGDGDDADAPATSSAPVEWSGSLLDAVAAAGTGVCARYSGAADASERWSACRRQCG
jgi:hypothetical protein